MLLVFLLYMILTWIALFVRMFLRPTYTMSPQLVSRITQAEPTCLARVMQNVSLQTANLTAHEAFLLVSRNPTLLQSYKWHSTDSFAYISHASLQCERMRIPPHVIPKSAAFSAERETTAAAVEIIADTADTTAPAEMLPPPTTLERSGIFTESAELPPLPPSPVLEEPKKKRKGKGTK
jgi:hypothetical protein